MCDIYSAPCIICGKLMPVHLGDYDTNRDEIECYCEDHIPNINVRIFTLKEDDDEYKKGWKMAIRSLTNHAWKNRDMNHPNLAADWTEVDI